MGGGGGCPRGKGRRRSDEGFIFREKRWKNHTRPFKSAPRDVTAGADPAMGGVKKVRPPPLWLSAIVSDSASYAAGDRPLCDVTKGSGVHHSERNPLPGLLLCGRLPPRFPNL